MSKKITIICAQCSKERITFPSLCKGRKIFFCDNKCKSEFQRGNSTGKDNPNYGNKWSEEQKQDASIIQKQRFTDPEQRFMAGKANRGKKFDQARIERMHANRTYRTTPHTNESKILIGKKSSEKWTNDYKVKHRKRFEELGYWIKLEDKEDSEIYFKESNWIARMFDLFASDILKEVGVFNCKTNKKGLVRDHILSRFHGFTHGVFPEILRHPANCQLITHSANVKKKSKRYVDRSDLTLEELFDRIYSYTGEWHEHDVAIERIEQYKNGNRWINTHKGGIL